MAGTQSLERAIGLLRLVAGSGASGACLAELTRRSGLSKPTAHRLLGCLEHQGLVERDGLGVFQLGAEAFVIGTLAAERHGIGRAAQAPLLRLAEATGDTSFLSVRRGWHVACLRRQEGAFPIRSHVLQAGDRHPLGVGAGSLAVLASLDDDEVEQAIEACGPEFATERYRAFTPAMLRRSVERTRADGFAFNPGLLRPESWGVGVAVLDRQGRCEAALSIAAIDSRLAEPRRAAIAALLRAEAARLGEALACPAGTGTGAGTGAGGSTRTPRRRASGTRGRAEHV